MAIAYDNASKSKTTSPGTALSWSHTCTGSNLGLVVGVVLRNGTSATVSGVTYNSVGMTNQGYDGGDVVKAALFTLAAPATGANTVAVTVSSTVDIILGFAVSYTGVHQTSGFGTATGTVGNSTAASLTVTSAANDLVVDILGQKHYADTEVLAVGADQTSRGEDAASNGATYYGQGGMSEEAGATSVTMSWSMAPNYDAWAQRAISLHPAPAAGGTGAPNLLLLGVG